jgi:hypothetical protein
MASAPKPGMSRSDPRRKAAQARWSLRGGRLGTRAEGIAQAIREAGVHLPILAVEPK